MLKIAICCIFDNFYNSLVYGDFALDYEYRQHFLCKP
jgi:hypothetical protein